MNIFLLIRLLLGYTVYSTKTRLSTVQYTAKLGNAALYYTLQFHLLLTHCISYSTEMTRKEWKKKPATRERERKRERLHIMITNAQLAIWIQDNSRLKKREGERESKHERESEKEWKQQYRTEKKRERERYWYWTTVTVSHIHTHIHTHNKTDTTHIQLLKLLMGGLQTLHCIDNLKHT